MIKKYSLIPIFFGLLGMFFGILIAKPSGLKAAEYHTLPYKMQLITAYESYRCNVEKLLDSNAEEILDTWAETDEYSDYQVSKERLDSIISLQDCPL